VELTTLNAVLKWAEQSFMAAKLYYGHGTNNAWDEAVALALYVLQLPSDVDASVGERVLTPLEKESYLQLVNQRIATRIPVPYLTHEAWFVHQKFYVDERVIIPRSPMGELILNGFQPWLGNRAAHRVLDLCTGSGCIAIACTKAFENAIIDAVDISNDALEVARKNCVLHDCEARVNLIHADLFSGCAGKRYDIIISNPPYVDSAEMRDLPQEYHWEPRLALAAGDDGLAIVQKILREAPKYLTENGLLFVEVGNTEEALKRQYPDLPLTWLAFENGGQGVFLLYAEDKSCWQDF
jgi:ribosomal protein L3 glutamine methyltransferase